MITRAGRAHARPVPRPGANRPPRRRRRKMTLAAVLMAVSVLLTGVGCSGSTGSGAASGEPAASTVLPRVVALELSNTTDEPRYRYVIEAGTGAALDAGREVRLLPPEFVVLRGDVIRIDNQDNRSHFIGPFYIPPGQEIQQRFESTGRYIGFCSVYPSGQVIIEVRERTEP